MQVVVTKFFASADGSSNMKAPQAGCFGCFARFIMKMSNTGSAQHMVKNNMDIQAGQTILEIGAGDGFAIEVSDRVLLARHLRGSKRLLRLISELEMSIACSRA